MKDSINQELRTLWQGDYLTCQACGNWIFQMPFTPKIVYWRNITNAYERHVKECFALKRLIVANRIFANNPPNIYLVPHEKL